MTDFSQNLRRLFDEAVEIDDSVRRAELVQSSCGGNQAVKERLENLLRAHEEAGGFLNSPETPEPLFADQPSERIGRYKLLQKLGEGGYGVVYMAEQLEPVKRRVALKIIKLGMDTRSVIARFEAERQALAMMDHPNIARVLDAGATETGRPYFVMELVRGIKITDYCDQNNLSMTERLKLFIQVCQAIQHAHQKGIIHRDLKPSNILVASHDDGTPVPKVIDFGIAKATADLHLTDKTLFTRFEMFIGTPAYMSPEQAEFNVSDVDTRTDIYALGVLVYELLTGRTPFDSDTLQNAGLEAMRRVIRETEPQRPSTRVRTLVAADLTEVAKRRQIEPLKLASQLHGDLDWIVLKALEKDRTRRYETANGLAMDIQRHLRHEPIAARPPSLTYALGKLVRRHRAAVMSALGMVALLVLGSMVSTWQAIRASQAEKRQREMRVVAEANERRADAARREADELATQNQGQLVRMHVAAGHKLMDERDDFAALLHFVEALRLEVDPAREAIHRRRLGSVLRSAPRLSQIWFHEGFVTDMRFNHDGSRVLTGSSDDKTLRVWDARTGSLAFAPIRFEEPMMGCRYTLDGSRMLTLDLGKKLQLWDSANGTLLHTAPQSGVTFLNEIDLSPDGRWISMPTSSGLQLLDAKTGASTGPRLEVAHLGSSVFSPDGRWLASFGSPTGLLLWEHGSQPATPQMIPTKERLRRIRFSPDSRVVLGYTLRDVMAWDMASRQMLWPSFQPGGDLFDCQFSPDGRLFATASWDGFARVYDTATSLPVGDSMRHRMGLAHSTFSPDGSLLVTASWDSTGRLWNPKTGAPKSPALHHAGYVGNAIFSPDGARVATSSQDQTVRLWELKSSETWCRVLRCPAGVKYARFSPDGSRILAGAFDGTVKIWEAATGKEIASMKLAGFGMDGAFSPDGKWVVVGGNARIAQLFNATTGKPIGPPVRHEAGLWTVDFSPNGRHILTSSADRTARIWDAVTGQPVGSPFVHQGEVKSARFSPDGSRVLTASYDGTAQIWDAATGQPLGPALKHECEVYAAHFSADGKRVVTAPSDRTQLGRAARIWDTATGQAIGQPLAHIDGVLCCEFSPDGRYVATGSEDKAAAVWDAVTGARLTLPLNHRSYVMKVRFSPDSRMVLTVGADGVARVWESATGEPVTPPLVHEKEALDGDWSPDGRQVLTASADGTVRVWDISPTEKPLDALKREAELLSAHRLQENFGAVLLSPAEIRERWEARRK